MGWLDVISPAARAVVEKHWRNPCSDAFEYLKRSHPADLLALCSSGALRPGELTYAAEIASACGDPDVVDATLRPLLDHPSPMVREGAIYGLQRNARQATWERIRQIAAEDPVAEVREVAAAAVEEYA